MSESLNHSLNPIRDSSIQKHLARRRSSHALNKKKISDLIFFEAIFMDKNANRQPKRKVNQYYPTFIELLYTSCCFECQIKLHCD